MGLTYKFSTCNIQTGMVLLIRYEQFLGKKHIVEVCQW